MIKDALEGVANGTYDIIAVRPIKPSTIRVLATSSRRGKGRNLHSPLYHYRRRHRRRDQYMALNGILAT